MYSKSLDYASSSTPRATRRWPWRALIVVIVLLLAVVLIPTPDVRQVESRMDSVTGSMTWKTVGIFGIGSGTRVDVSPLEKRLVKSGIAWTPNWMFLHNTHRNLFGRAVGYECGLAPPIYSIHTILGEFADASTDDELREFVRVLQTGTENEQKAAVEAAGDKGLQFTAHQP